MSNLISVTERGLHCAVGDFYIDPWLPVPRAVITHAHADHARRGHQRYLTTIDGYRVLASRMEPGALIDTIDYGESILMGNVRLSLHPAGHVLGSAQVRIERQGEVCVVSGDYKTTNDPTCRPFAPIPCHMFISECTFGLPIYRWPNEMDVFHEINQWWRSNREQQRASIVFAYSLGKAQRIVAGVDASIGPIYCHGAVQRVNQDYRDSGVPLPETHYTGQGLSKHGWAGTLIVAPPSAIASPWVRKFGDASTAFVSGWMQVRGTRRRRSVDRGFVLSDHADWPGLLAAIHETGAERILLTHGQTGPMVRWLQESGHDARALHTEFVGERDDIDIDVADEVEADFMNRFASLYRELDETTKTKKKIAAMRNYFAHCTASDGAWAVFFLSGRRFKRLIPVSRLRDWCETECRMPSWLFDECYGATGDLAETMALVLPEREQRSSGSLTEWIEQRIRPLATLSDHDQQQALLTAWGDLSTQERLVFNKLVTGEFRVGVAQQMVIRSLSDFSGVTPQVIAHRLMGTWEPTAEFFRMLISPDGGESDHSKPFPFCLAHPVSSAIEELGDVCDWLIEWKWDGIRGQVIRRNGHSFVWSRGEESMLERFPELVASIERLPDGTVLDGEIVAWNETGILPFAEMQRRIGRKSIGKKLLADVPVKFLAFDLLEENGMDIRNEPLTERRRRLEQILQHSESHESIMISPLVTVPSWTDLAAMRQSSRERHVEGMMLKRADSEYGTGRVTGLWWKWKIEPYTCDAVLIYAQRGHGRRASLYTDYTFGAWENGTLVPFAKAYSGLTDQEIREVDRYVRQHTLEKFGPVRSVTPELVFELAFEDIQLSKRHKSGIAVRFPRIVRWRKDKKPEEADSLTTLQNMLQIKDALR